MSQGVYDRRLNPHCEDLRPCFARKDKHCTILLTTYAQGECPFAKRKQSDKLSYYAQLLREQRLEDIDGGIFLEGQI